MADYRLYRRDALVFDGVTGETATYAQIGRLFTTGANGAVGLFGPQVLGRKDVASVVQVLPQAGTVLGGGTAQARIGAFVRRSVPITSSGSVPFLLTSGETLSINAPGVTGVEILVNDLDDAQASDWLNWHPLDVPISSGIAGPIFITGNFNAVPWIGSPQAFQVQIGTPASTITLPDPSQLQDGAWCVVLNLSAALQTIAAPGGASVNGAPAVTVNPGEAAIVVRLAFNAYSKT